MIKEFFLLPNLLSFLRIPLGFTFVILYVAAGNQILIWHFVISMLIELTDALDGHLARSMKQTSNIGKVLDPMADSFSRCMLLVTLTVAGLFPLIALSIILFRDTLVPFVRQQMAIRGVAMAARGSGKIKAIVQAIYINFTIGMLMILPNYFDAKFFSLYGGTVVALVTIWSGYDYLMSMIEALKKENSAAKK